VALALEMLAELRDWMLCPLPVAATPATASTGDQP
jgi:hypothetical protein